MLTDMVAMRLASIFLLKTLPLMGATRLASEKMQLLFSRVRFYPTFSIPTRDASPPLEVALGA